MGFTRKKEDFDCVHCGLAVKGNGYTNHCPRCLWSRHVDLTPGDRANTCCGMMRPAGAEVVHDGYRIHHRCETCGYVAVCDAAKNDDIEAIIKAMSV